MAGSKGSPGGRDFGARWNRAGIVGAGDVRLAAADELYDFELRARVQDSFAPKLGFENFAVQFDGDTLGIDLQFFQKLQNGYIFRCGLRLAVDYDLDAHVSALDAVLNFGEIECAADRRDFDVLISVAIIS
jgi:hypothetical protein